MTMALRRMRIWGGLGLLAVLAGFVLWNGCSSDSTTAPQSNNIEPPTNLTWVLSDVPPQSVDLQWDPSSSDVDGYRVYRSRTSMGTSVPPDSLRVGTVQGVSFTDEGLAIGKYYYEVRAYKGNSVSGPSNEIDTAPRQLSDTLRVSEFRAAGPSGIDLSGRRVLHMTSGGPHGDNRADVDLFLDSLGTGLGFKSPALTGGTGWMHTDLKLLGSGQSAWDTGTTTDAGWSDRVSLGADPVDQVVAVKTTKGGETHFAKIRVLSLSGASPDRQIVIEFAYQPVPDYIRFRVRH